MAARGLPKEVNAGRLNGTARSRQCWGARLPATLGHRIVRCPFFIYPLRQDTKPVGSALLALVDLFSQPRYAGARLPERRLSW